MGQESTRGLEISEDLEFQKKEWKAAPFVWAIWVVFLALGLAGLFGGGPLAHATAGDGAEGLEVEYERFTRADAPDHFVISAVPQAGAERLGVWFKASYLTNVEVGRVQPQPVEEVLDDDRLVYWFAIDDAREPLSITFQITHQSMSFTRSEAGVVDGPSVDFWQVVYP